MGEAKRRQDAATAAHPMLPRAERPKPPRLREYTITINQTDDAALRLEHQHMQKKYTTLALTSYIVALVNAAVEQERMAREQEEQRGNMVVLAAPKVHGTPLATVPAGQYVGRRSR